MAIKAVIFDLDGTLVSFNLDFTSVRVEVRSLLIRAGVPASILSINESIFDMLQKTEIFFKNSGKSERTVSKIRNEALNIAEKHELEAAKTTGLLPGAPGTLQDLKKMKLKLGLCTISSEKSTNYILKRFEIGKFFDAIVPRNKVKNVKPNTEHLETVLKNLKVKASEAMVVGDSGRDMKCARDAGTLAVGLPTGVATQERLVNSGANYFVTTLTDLPNLIETINRKRSLRTGKEEQPPKTSAIQDWTE